MARPQLLTATRILERTMPATTRRLLIYGAVVLAYLSSIPLGAGTFFGLASFSRNPGFWAQIGAVLGLVACIYCIRLARATLFHQVDLIHVAAMVKRLTGQDLPSGREQLEYLRASIRQSYPSAPESFAGYLNVRRFIGEAFASLPPGSRLSRLPQPLAVWLQAGLANLLLGFSAGAILAFAVRESHPATCRRGALVFCANYPEVFRQGLILSTFLYGASLAAFWLLLKPVGWVDAALPSGLGLWLYVFALILTYWVKAAFLDPIVTAAMMITLLQREPRTPFDEATVQAWERRLPSLARLGGG